MLRLSQLLDSLRFQENLRRGSADAAAYEAGVLTERGEEAEVVLVPRGDGSYAATAVLRRSTASGS